MKERAEMCGSLDPTKTYICTMRLGHAGVHTAGGIGSKVCATWPALDNSAEATAARRAMFSGFGWSVTR